MAITIKGIKIESVILGRDENGAYKVSSSEYSLISSKDTVLAKQTVGGYGGMVLEPSPATKKALETFISGYIGDVTALLGLAEEA
jgi:hypothetical protein